MANNESDISIKYDAEEFSLSQSEEIYSIEGECLFDGAYALNMPEDNEPSEMIDYEELIDFQNSLDKKSKLVIKENVFNSFEIFEECMVDNKIGLNEINEYFEQIESCNLNMQNTPVSSIENRESKNIKVEDIEEDNLHSKDNNIKLETRYNDAAICIDLIRKSEDVSSVDSKTEIISISYEDDDTPSIVSDGYQSSDFEFITEAEAKMDSYLINFNKNNHEVKRSGSITSDKNTSQINEELNTTLDNPAEGSQRVNRQANVDANNLLTSPQDLQSQSEAGRNGSLLDAGEGPSGLDRPIYDYSNRDYRQNHLIPEGEGYLDLFQGQYNPVLPMSDIILLENKSIRPSPMNIQYEGMGFDRQLIWRKCQPDSSEDEFEDEANESIEKILSMYPDYNGKPKKTF